MNDVVWSLQDADKKMYAVKKTAGGARGEGVDGGAFALLNDGEGFIVVVGWGAWICWLVVEWHVKEVVVLVKFMMRGGRGHTSSTGLGESLSQAATCSCFCVVRFFIFASVWFQVCY
jgi:hypothetical protein